MEDASEPSDLKNQQRNSNLPSNYFNNVLELITYVDSVLEDPLRGSKEKRRTELCDLSCLLLKAEQGIKKLLENNKKLHFSQLNSVQWYLKGRRYLTNQQAIRV